MSSANTSPNVVTHTVTSHSGQPKAVVAQKQTSTGMSTAAWVGVIFVIIVIIAVIAWAIYHFGFKSKGHSAGSTCSKNTDCMSGTFCSSDGKCTNGPGVKTGGTCSHDAECLIGLSCKDKKCSESIQPVTPPSGDMSVEGAPTPVQPVPIPLEPVEQSHFERFWWVWLIVIIIVIILIIGLVYFSYQSRQRKKDIVYITKPYSVAVPQQYVLNPQYTQYEKDLQRYGERQAAAVQRWNVSPTSQIPVAQIPVAPIPVQ